MPEWILTYLFVAIDLAVAGAAAYLFGCDFFNLLIIMTLFSANRALVRAAK